MHRSSHTHVNHTQRPLHKVFAATAVFSLSLLAAQTHAQNLLVTSAATDSVKQYRWSDGAYLGDFIAPGSGGLNEPSAIRYGPDGNWYVASKLTSSILRYDGTTGAFLGVFVPALSGGLTWPHAMTFAPNGDLLVASDINGQECIKRYYAGSGGYAGDFACLSTPEDVSHSCGLATGPGGDLFVSWTSSIAYGSNIVRQYNSTTGALVRSYSNATLSGPFNGLVVTATGNLLVANGIGDGVVRFSTATGAFLGNFVGDGLPGGSSTDPDDPDDIVIGPNGNLFAIGSTTTFAGISSGPSRVMEYNATTGAFVRTYVAASSGGLNGAIGLAFRPVPPAAVDGPFPPDGSTGRPLVQDISWPTANGAPSYTVYFGTDSTPDPTELLGTQAGGFYALPTLSPLTTYYWRIDSTNIFGTTTGPVWSFTTRSVDTTGDGIIDIDDLLAVIVNFGGACAASTTGGLGCDPCTGDVDGDCDIDIDDLLLIITNFS